jgi:hypothetical protein
MAEWLISDIYSEDGGGGVPITEADKEGETLWFYLGHHIRKGHHSGVESKSTEALASLLKAMILMADAPPEFMRYLRPHHAWIVERGNDLRSKFPMYLEEQRNQVAAHCPLPTVLQNIVAGYAARTHLVWEDRKEVRAIAAAHAGRAPKVAKPKRSWGARIAAFFLL